MAGSYVTVWTGTRAVRIDRKQGRDELIHSALTMDSFCQDPGRSATRNGGMIRRGFSTAQHASRQRRDCRLACNGEARRYCEEQAISTFM